MHNAAFNSQKKANPQLEECRYFRFEIDPEDLEKTLPLFFEKKFRGLNLTIPHKVAVLPFLKSISPEAEIIGAANTLVRDDILGGWRGENTDGRGFARAAKMQLGVKLAGTHVVLLGAGGAARAVAATALAQNCASLSIVNRSRERAETLINSLKHSFQALSSSIFEFPPTDEKRLRIFSNEAQNKASDPHGTRTLIVNATSLGLKPDDASPCPPEFLQDGTAIYDTTYGTHTSALLEAARRRRLPAADGRTMLAWQGALAFEIWNTVPAEDVFPVMLREITQQRCA